MVLYLKIYSYLITTVACFKADCRGLRLKGGFIHDVKKKLSNYLETLNVSLVHSPLNKISTAEYLETVGISPQQCLQKIFPTRVEKSRLHDFFTLSFLHQMLKKSNICSGKKILFPLSQPTLKPFLPGLKKSRKEEQEDIP